MWQTKNRAKMVEFSELGTLLKYLCASPKNKIVTQTMELYMDDENVFHMKKKGEMDFKTKSPSIDELMSIVKELKEKNLFQDIAIDVLYCEM